MARAKSFACFACFAWALVLRTRSGGGDGVRTEAAAGAGGRTEAGAGLLLSTRVLGWSGDEGGDGASRNPAWCSPASSGDEGVSRGTGGGVGGDSMAPRRNFIVGARRNFGANFFPKEMSWLPVSRSMFPGSMSALRLRPSTTENSSTRKVFSASSPGWPAASTAASSISTGGGVGVSVLSRQGTDSFKAN